MLAIRLPEPRDHGLGAATVRVDVRQQDGTRRTILLLESLTLQEAAQVAVTGPSGAGKTTLLAVLSGLVRPDTGRISWREQDIAGLSERARDRWRLRNVGLVFQDFHLIPELGVLDNVLLPARFATLRPGSEVRERAEALLASVGLIDLRRRRAGLLSRGEQQRAAIARALLHDPRIILADEPTASLDQDNGRAVIDLLVGTANRSGATLICATHDPALIARLGTRWHMEAGRIRPAGAEA